MSSYEKYIASGVKKNARAFWSYVNSKITTRESVCNLTKPDGSKTETDQEKAEVLQDFFSSVFTKEDLQDIPLPSDVEFDTPLDDIQITSGDVFELLRRLKPNKSPGPDNIHPRLLKELADVLALPISLLFQKSLESKQLPQDWKSANVTPIFKKGNKGDSKNYRPVSLTSIICKMMENLVRKQLLDHLMTNDLISVHQHGFVVGRSCITNLLEVLDQWTQILDDGGTVDAIYLDFMKAFDTVPHHRLLLTLESYGVCGNDRCV